jgi:hypothetical protein
VRVGVVLDEHDVRRWHEIAIEQIEAVSEVVVLAGEPPRRESTGLRHLLYRAYELVDRRVFAGDDDPLARVPLRRPAVPLAEGEDLDATVHLPADPAPGLFRRMYEGESVAPIALGAGSVVKVDRVSLHRSRCRVARRAAHLPARALRATREQPAPVEAEESALPTNSMMLRFLWRVATGVLRRRVTSRLREQQWFIGYRQGSAPTTLIMPPPGRFYADPFLFQRDGRRYVFFEDFDWGSGRAEIRYVEIDDRGGHGSPQPALREDCHLSYPFVFADGDEVYMLPETAERGTVELYRAASFPDEWTLERVLLSDVTATDSTLLRHDDRWWLFVGLVTDGNRPIDELCLFSSDSLDGPWEPHPRNPVVSDVRSARPAGRVFARNGHLIRPAQDCSETYGGRLVFNRIDLLSPTEYREEPIGVIEPTVETGNLATHSYDSDGTYEVLDGFRLRPRLALAGKLRAARSPRWHRIDLEA